MDESQKYAFKKIKRIVARDTLLTYPYFNEAFKIHTYASAFQSGEVIIQKDKTIALYSRKLNDEQKKYTVTDKEVLSIIETLNYFRTTLLGQKIRIYTDHKNLTCKNFNTGRVLRWRLIPKEYGPDIEYIKGEKNVVVDAISIFPLNGYQKTTQKFIYQN